MAYSPETQKIDKKAVDGLLGTNNSLAYKVHEIEKHFHNRERWMGQHASVSGEVNCGQTGTLTSFQTDAGNDTWGAAVCIIGTGDTPVIAGNAKFDLHRLDISDVENAANKITHYIQIIYGTGTSADAITAGQYSEIICTPEKDGKTTPYDIIMPRVDDATKIWVRHWVDGVNTATMDFYVGIHEYVG